MRWQIWIGFKKGFVASYQGTALGVIWALLLPLLPVSVYVILVYIKVVKTSNEMPFVIYIMTGMVLYLFMTGTISSVINSVEREKSILKKVKYPTMVVMLSNFGQVGFELLIRLVFLVPIFFFFNVIPSILLVLLPLLLSVVFVLFLSIGMILAILNVVYPDVRNTVEVIVRYGLFFSSVIFAMPTQGIISSINMFNPFNTIVVFVRESVVIGKIGMLNEFLILAVLAPIMFVMACRLVYVMEVRIKDFL